VTGRQHRAHGQEATFAAHKLDQINRVRVACGLKIGRVNSLFGGGARSV
jgi:hypothetical protein